MADDLNSENTNKIRNDIDQVNDNINKLVNELKGTSIGSQSDGQSVMGIKTKTKQLPKDDDSVQGVINKWFKISLVETTKQSGMIADLATKMQLLSESAEEQTKLLQKIADKEIDADESQPGKQKTKKSPSTTELSDKTIDKLAQAVSNIRSGDKKEKKQRDIPDAIRRRSRRSFVSKAAKTITKPVERASNFLLGSLITKLIKALLPIAAAIMAIAAAIIAFKDKLGDIARSLAAAKIAQIATQALLTKMLTSPPDFRKGKPEGKSKDKPKSKSKSRSKAKTPPPVPDSAKVKPTTKPKKGLIGKIKSAGSAIKNAGAATAAKGAVLAKSVGSTAVNMAKDAGKMVSGAAKASAAMIAKPGVKSVTKGLGKLAGPVGIGLGIYDIYTGGRDAAEILGKNEKNVTAMDRITAGMGKFTVGYTNLAKAAGNLVGLPKLFGKDKFEYDDANILQKTGESLGETVFDTFVKDRMQRNLDKQNEEMFSRMEKMAGPGEIIVKNVEPKMINDQKVSGPMYNPLKERMEYFADGLEYSREEYERLKAIAKSEALKDSADSARAQMILDRMNKLEQAALDPAEIQSIKKSVDTQVQMLQRQGQLQSSGAGLTVELPRVQPGVSENGQPKIQPRSSTGSMDSTNQILSDNIKESKKQTEILKAVVDKLDNIQPSNNTTAVNINGGPGPSVQQQASAHALRHLNR